MQDVIAIDFGTSRTKLAYWDPGTGKPELMRLGYHEERFAPSLFYLARDSEQILWGYEAEEMLAEDPPGIVDVLKRRLRETYVWANRRRLPPGVLLAWLLTHLRTRAGRELTARVQHHPTQVCLTIPALYGPTDERLVHDAARQAGFTEVTLVPEPVAAARAWLAETGGTTTEVVALDCGGGTIDWAYLRRDGEDFRLVPACPPGGDNRVGGHDAVLEARFIAQTCENVERYLGQVRTVTGGSLPPLLLVGGGARLKGLAAALEARCACATVWWERSEYATVLGAVPHVVSQRQVVTPPAPAQAPVSVSPPVQQPAPERPQTLRNSFGMEFVLIPAGEFRMGDPETEEGSGSSERPQHRVRISQSFYLGKYPATQTQWKAVMHTSPSYFRGDPHLQVENVSWEDVQQFLQRLNAQEGEDIYRLPTEAEWEYAARARSTTAYCFGNDPEQLGAYAWYAVNAGQRTHPMGQKQPNAWGLYDMHGNVWEWVQDWSGLYEAEVVTNPQGPSLGSYRVYRGGSWNRGARSCRSAYRDGGAPGRRIGHVGFRLLRRVS